MEREELLERIDEIRYVCEEADTLDMLHKLRRDIENSKEDYDIDMESLEKKDELKVLFDNGTKKVHVVENFPEKQAIHVNIETAALTVKPKTFSYSKLAPDIVEVNKQGDTEE